MLVIVILLALLPTSAFASSNSIYGYTCLSGKWLNNVTGKIVGGKPSPSIEKNANTISLKAQIVLNELKRKQTVSRGTDRSHPYASVIRSVGRKYWTDNANLDALVWISAHECIKPGGLSKSGKYKGLFQLGNSPKWMILGDAESETKAGCEYIVGRYRTPVEAKQFWLSHRWY